MIRVSSFLFIGLCVGLFFTHPAIASDIPQFTEQAEAGGITHVYDGDFEYYVGGGAASFDCNNDRLADVFIAGGQTPRGSMSINPNKAGKSVLPNTPLPMKSSIPRAHTRYILTQTTILIWLFCG